MKTAKTIASIACTTLIASSAIGATQGDRPNVLFISIDDLNNWTGFLKGHPQVKTPNLDKLAAQSVVFERAYCSASVCNPSRAALMTGIRPSTSGVYTNKQNFRDSKLLKNALTIPQYFHKFGYFTTASGKIFHHPSGRWADTGSWEKWVPQTGNLMSKHPGQTKTRTAGGMTMISPKQKSFDWGPLDIKTKDTRDFHTAKWAAEELNRVHKKPFFIACGIFKPHLPFYVPKKYFDLYPLDTLIIPEIDESDVEDLPVIAKAWTGYGKPNSDYNRLKKHGKLKHIVQAYLAAISYADACVGEIMKGLNKSPYKKNTIVVLWGDHGWHLGEKLCYRKAKLWERATLTTLLIKAPDVSKAGGRCKRVVNLIDLYPTLIDLCGLPKKGGLEGRSLKPLLENPNTKWPYPSLTTMKFKRHTIRTEKWRYIRYNDGSEELYDHDKDPDEKINLARQPEYRKEIKQLSKYLPKTDAPEAPITKGK